MARDILGEYGRDSNAPMAARASNGGKMPVRDVNNYSTPKGPTNIKDGQSPGLHGDNYGCCGTQGKYSNPAQTGGSPGLHGDNRSNSGSQGKR